MTLWVIFLFILMEWLFFITMPSFMDVMSLAEKLAVLLVSVFVVALICLIVLLGLRLISWLPGLRRGWKVFLIAGAVVPTFFMAALTLLLVDNFTYTVFKFGVVSTEDVLRGVYAALFLIILIFWYWKVTGSIFAITKQPVSRTGLKKQMQAGAVLLLISFTAAVLNIDTTALRANRSSIGETDRKPNIIVIGGDGINATSIGLYGYERGTTPFLSSLSESSLLVENAFTNSANTSGAIITIFTSKLPTTTHVIYPPDILRGSDAYEHLPNILRLQGYYNVQISVEHFVDALTLNVRDGFHSVNQRVLKQGGVYSMIQQLPFQNAGYFLSSLVGRVTDRLGHIFFVRQMINPYSEVTGSTPAVTDEERINQLINVFTTTDQPVFAHVHLLSTHGPYFSPQEQFYSVGQVQDAKWMTDFYDDAVLEFDTNIARLVDALKTMGKWENTVLVVYSDHNRNYATHKRIPLMFHFPSDAYAGKIRNNAQLIDIAPTLVDYLGMPIPDWMQGISLLDGEPDPMRPVFSTAVHSILVENQTGSFEIDTARVTPPYYQFAYLRVVVCDRYTSGFLQKKEWYWGAVEYHTNPCSSRLSGMQFRQTIVDRLEHEGYDPEPMRAILADDWANP